MTEQEKKAFALEQIAPYFKDPNTCGLSEEGFCMNLTPEGKMCVAGKNYLPEVRKEYPGMGVTYVLNTYDGDQSLVFIESAANKLTLQEWVRLQCIHDSIARRNKETLKNKIEILNLFTLEELAKAANSLP